jgi:hypothetical protein
VQKAIDPMKEDKMNASKNVAITTSPELIRLLGKKLYTNHSMTILARELLQNSRDATLGGGKINMTMEKLGNDQISISCTDTGIGMGEDTLLNIFLAIGRTGKAENDQAVGGFGVAKVSLFCQDKWEVHTRDNEVHCEGNDSPSFSKVGKIKGTVVTASTKIDANVTSIDYVMRKAMLFIFSSNVRNLYFDAVKVKAYVGKKILHRDDDCTVSTAPYLVDSLGNKVCGYIFFRIRGLTQFCMAMSDVRTFNVLVDFNNIAYRPTDDRYPFGMSRESVAEKYSVLVSELISPLIKNIISSNISHSGTKSVKERVAVSKSTKRIVVEAPRKNKGEGKVTSTHRQIERLWEIIFERMHISAHFGLTYDVDTLGEHRQHKGTEYFLVNGKLVEEYIERYYSEEDPVALVVWMFHLACHELAHRDCSDHDENFTCREGDIASKNSPEVFAHLNTIRVQARKVLHAVHGKEIK